MYVTHGILWISLESRRKREVLKNRNQLVKKLFFGDFYSIVIQ